MTPAPPLPPDERLDPHDDAAVRRWCDHFGITIAQLEEAVRAAGPVAADVERLLREQGASAGVG